MSAASPERADSASPRLADSLALVLPSLPAQLVGLAALPWLTSVASALPPVHRGGFECRLTADEDDVNLRQGIFVTDGEPGRLARFLAAAMPLNDAWGAVLRLADRWSTPAGPLHDGITELWLELDSAPGRPDRVPSLSDVAPSVFAVLRRADSARSMTAARAFIAAILGETGSVELDDELTRVVRACPEPAGISHIGLMLGRSVAGMRVHVSRIPVGALDEYLLAVGWSGNRQEVLSLAEVLLDYGDVLIVCLDVVHGRIVRLGLECFFSENIGLGPRWRPLLERLTNLGLCSADKADALVRWPGGITPVNSPGPWPENLIVQSLTQPGSELGMLDRRLSHVKLSCVPDLPVSAKVYLGYGHVWTHKRIAGEQASHRLGRRPASTVLSSIDAAVDWLLDRRHQSGWWRDFFGTRFVDSSDEWVTAYVGDALAGVPLSRALTAAREGLELLLTRRERTSGWGYNVILPADGDGTTWALRLARSLGAPDHERLAAGRHLIRSLTDSDGGVASYTEEAVTPLDRILRMGGSYEGWCAAHLCITAPAAILGITEASRSYLRASQNQDGSWSSYWWDEDEYATAWAVQALAGSAANRDALAAAVTWCAHRIGADGAVRAGADGAPSAFATALVLYAIRAGGASGSENDAAAHRAQRWLLEHQLEDGAWEASARLRVPQTSVHDPSESPELIMYHIPDCGVWTTATVLAALSAGLSAC